MLATLVLLTVVPAGIALLRLGPPWLAAPPAFMLAGFLVLLREAAKIDAERARPPALATGTDAGSAAGQQDHAPAWQPAPARVHATATPAATTPLPAAALATASPHTASPHTAGPPGQKWAGQHVEATAQVIDIFDRVGDQLYDQYADAAERAVGD